MSERTYVLRDDTIAQRAAAFIAGIGGKGMEVLVRPHSPKRSVDQNARYWAILTEIADKVTVEGKHFSPETWHVYFRLKFLPTRVLFGQVVPLSTTKLSKTKFADYCTQIEAHAAQELGVEFDYREAG